MPEAFDAVDNDYTSHNELTDLAMLVWVVL